MGCDGGTIPKRDELVKTKQKPEQKDKDSVTAFKWMNCAISQGALRAPIVACELGRLYSKESVLECLLAKSMPENATHLRSLKDVKQVNLTENPAKDSARNSHRTVADWMCPVSGLEMNGKHKFVMIWSCGCVFSERAIKHVPTTVCHVCQRPFVSADVVILNAEGEDLKAMEESMDARRALRASEKKSKKEKSVTNGETEPSTSSAAKRSIEESESGASSSKVAKIVPSKHGKEPLENGKLGKGEKKPKAAAAKRYDPKERDSYKSLFTSHETAKNQPKAHWVTYNPFFN